MSNHNHQQQPSTAAPAPQGILVLYIYVTMLNGFYYFYLFSGLCLGIELLIFVML